MEPLVSVLIPLYNSEKYVTETINSVLNQTYENIEVIIVDDGSDDRSFEIAKGFKLDNVKVFTQENKGACAARNFAFSVAKGEYVMFLDADDLLSEDKVLKQIDVLLKNGKNTIPFCGWGRFNKEIEDYKFEKQDINKDYYDSIELLIDCWRGEGMWLNSIFLMHREIIERAGGWNEDLLINQDGEFFARVLLQANKLIFTEGLVYYRSGNLTSISRSKKTYQKAKSLLFSYQLYQKHLKEYLDYPKLRIALGANYLSFFYQYYSIFPSLAEEAFTCFLQLKVKERIVNGSLIFKILARLFGIRKVIQIKNRLI